MTLVGCFVSPHPPIMVPEVGGSELRRIEATVRSMQMLRSKAAGLMQVTIVLLSPHDPLSARHMGVSFASSYRGSLAYFRAPQVTLSVAGDDELGGAIVEHAANRNIPTTIIASVGDEVDLDHGSMVPLVYIMGGLTQACRLVILSFSQLGCHEHVRFGEAVGEVIVRSPRRVLYVASSDLSHRLIPGAPAGYDPRGAEFDKQVVETFGAGDWQGLLSIPSTLTAAAGECGYRSMTVLSGVVGAARAAGLHVRNRVLSYEGPFGVGYLVGEVEVGEADTVHAGTTDDGPVAGVGQ